MSRKFLNELNKLIGIIFGWLIILSAVVTYLVVKSC